MTRPPDALLALENGMWFRGRSLGAEGEALGEAVFNTAMAGYQEVMTDPSYTRQIVTMTSVQQGNYGTNHDDPESSAVRVAGLAVREASRRASSWRAERTLAEELRDAGIVGIEGIDTRRLTIAIRSSGAMRGAISTQDLDPASLAERARESAGMEGADLAASVSVSEPFRAEELVGPADGSAGRIFRVAAYDFGMKRNILRRLAATGCDATVFPATTPAAEVLAGGFDGVFLSNGPGDPAATSYGVRVVQELIGDVPVFGICLGHQLLAQALGGRTYKMRFGHRGANQPVKDLDTGRIEVTSHNHGFAVDPESLGASEEAAEDEGPPLVDTPAGRVALTHWNLNDRTLEGLRCLDVPAFSVQYHPEAAPGPHDSRYLFESFRVLMDAAS